MNIDNSFGVASYHFEDENNVYINWENFGGFFGVDWIMDNGEFFPNQKQFTETYFDYDNRTFLDIGSGCGKIIISIADKLNITSTGIEIDKNRFEQELIYYIEKFDINEEKIRHESHLKFFAETLKNEKYNGKKLGFISQEIGREINTIGSKSNDLLIQKIVVEMKDELEKIKEQLLNVL